MTDARVLLNVALTCAVPLRIMELERMPEPDVVRQRWAAEAVDVVAGHGDALMFRDRHTGEAFSHLARGIAALAFQPGGVPFLDFLYCAAHHPCPRSELLRSLPVPAVQDRRRPPAGDRPP